MNKEKENLNNELNKFKNDILEIIRSLEYKLIEQINNRNIELLTKINNLQNKVLIFEEDNSSIKNTLTDNKLKIEKINEFELYFKKIDNTIMTHNIRLKKILYDLENIKSKYDKLIMENLTVMGYVGPTCQYKNISDYISSNIKESCKIKLEIETTKFEINNIKSKIDNSYKNLVTLIDASLNKSNSYTNNKQEAFNDIVNGKIEDINNKIIEFKMKDIQTQNEIEKLGKEFKEYFDRLKKIRNKLEKKYDENIKCNNKNNDNNNITNENINDNIEKNNNISKNNSNKNNLNKGILKDEQRYSLKGIILKDEKKEEKEKEEIKEVNEKIGKEKKENGKIIEKEVESNKVKENNISNKNQSNKEIKEIKEIKELILNNKIIKDNINKYELELESIKYNIKIINTKLEKLTSILDLKKSEKVTNTEPNNKSRKKSKILQTDLDNEKLNSHTIDNIYQNNFLSENESDENSRNIMNENLYKNILFSQYNQTKKNRHKSLNSNNNFITKIYDLDNYSLFDKNNNSFIKPISKNYQNNLNKTNYMNFKKFINKDENKNNEPDNNKYSKDLFLLKYSKKQFLKEKNSNWEKSWNNSGMLDKKIMETIRFILKENKYLKSKNYNKNKSSSQEDINKINLSFSNNNIIYQNYNNYTRNEIEKKQYYTPRCKLYKVRNNNLIKISNDKNTYNKISLNKNTKSINYFRNQRKIFNYDESIEKRSKHHLSPIVDKLYKDYYNKNNYNKNNYQEEKKLNYSNKCIMPKKIVPAFGRTFYQPINYERRHKN